MTNASHRICAPDGQRFRNAGRSKPEIAMGADAMVSIRQRKRQQNGVGSRRRRSQKVVGARIYVFASRANRLRIGAGGRAIPCRSLSRAPLYASDLDLENAQAPSTRKPDAKSASTPRFRIGPNCVRPISTPPSPSIPYDNGSTRVATMSAVGRLFSGKERAGEKDDRHHEKVHDELKALHIFQRRSDRGAKSREHQADEQHEQAIWRIWSAASARSSRIVEPVNTRKPLQGTPRSSAASAPQPSPA